MPKPGWPSSSSSRAGTIRDGVTPPSDICHPSTTKEASYSPARPNPYLLIHESPLTDALFLLVSKSDEVTTT